MLREARIPDAGFNLAYLHEWKVFYVNHANYQVTCVTS
jgi:hypothetical protein